MSERSEWIWMPHPAHLIVSRWCRFHMATMVGQYIVSTVGEYVHPRHAKGSESGEAKWLKKNWPGEDVGYGRKYETMVFPAGQRVEGRCCQYEPSSWLELESRGYQTSEDAFAGHMELCEQWSKKT